MLELSFTSCQCSHVNTLVCQQCMQYLHTNRRISSELSLDLHKSGNELSLDLHKSGHELSSDLHKSGTEFI